MQNNDRLSKILGFAQRARKLTLGMSATTAALKKKQLKALIVAIDTSAGSRNKIMELAQPARIPVFRHGSKEAFGLMFGRREVGIIGIVDPDFAKSVADILK